MNGQLVIAYGFDINFNKNDWVFIALTDVIHLIAGVIFCLYRKKIEAMMLALLVALLCQFFFLAQSKYASA